MSAIYIITTLPSLLWGTDRAFRFIGFYAIGTVLASFKADERIKKIQISVEWITAAMLLTINFVLSYMNLDIGCMWFVTATIGTIAVLIISIAINKNRVLEYIGSISLIVVCIHGPVYRILVKVMSILLRMSTDAVRENLILALIVTVLTLYVSVIAFQIINKFMPWMIGERKSPQHQS